MKTRSNNLSHCLECQKEIPAGTEYFDGDWCLDCGEKQLKKIEVVRDREDKMNKSVLFKIIFYPIAISIFILGITNSYIATFLGAFLFILIIYHVNGFRDEPAIIFYTIPIALLIIIGLSIAGFCKMQSFLNFEWLSEKACSGYSISPEEAGSLHNR